VTLWPQFRRHAEGKIESLRSGPWQSHQWVVGAVSNTELRTVKLQIQRSRDAQIGRQVHQEFRQCHRPAPRPGAKPLSRLPQKRSGPTIKTHVRRMFDLWCLRLPLLVQKTTRPTTRIGRCNNQLASECRNIQRQTSSDAQPHEDGEGVSRRDINTFPTDNTICARTRANANGRLLIHPTLEAISWAMWNSVVRMDN